MEMITMTEIEIDEVAVTWAKKQTWNIMDLSGVPKHILTDILQCEHDWEYGLTSHFNIWSGCKSCGVHREMTESK
jgi:hypothetical protein